MTTELIILMAWHEESNANKIACFEENKRTFISHNPGIEVITVLNPFDDPKIAWLSTDLSIFYWYLNNRDTVFAEKYLLVEWDCWCDIDLKEYYRRVWDLDIIAPSVKYPERDKWAWFNSINRLPVHARLYATGIVPFCGILVSRKAMNAIAEEIIKPEYEGLNSELRFATIATMLGFDPIVNPVLNRTVNWKEPVPFNYRTKGLHHPRKTLISPSVLSPIKSLLQNNGDDMPKIIHQTWKDENLPREIAVLSDTWKELHPDWTYILWTDDMNREFIKAYFPEFLLQFDSYDKHIQRVDAVRYFILYKLGGLFIDMDFECLANIEPLLENQGCVFAQEPQAHCDQFGKDKIICNAFMASRPNHDFFKTICESLSEMVINKRNHIDNILSSTGPFALTNIYDNYHGKQTVTLLESETVYPLTAKEARIAMSEDLHEALQAKIDHAFAVHYFFGTWY